eukprot:6863953-Heterocapsa_arctica.AAC.1
MIKNCSMRLLDLVTDTMDLNSMKSKTMKLNKAPCNLTQIIEETVHMLDHATNKYGEPVKSSTVKLINRMEDVCLPIIDADVHRCTQ